MQCSHLCLKKKSLLFSNFDSHDPLEPFGRLIILEMHNPSGIKLGVFLMNELMNFILGPRGHLFGDTRYRNQIKSMNAYQVVGYPEKSLSEQSRKPINLTQKLWINVE